MFDGSDCDHGHDECYTELDGKDYRGSMNKTEDGNECLVWSQMHGVKYVHGGKSGLGGHNHCRNPTLNTSKSNWNNGLAEEELGGTHPWCWKAHRSTEFSFGREYGRSWGYCKVGEPTQACGDQSFSEKMKQGITRVSNEAEAAPLIAAILSIAATLFIGLAVFTYHMLKRHKQMYATLQQKLQASQELSALTSTVDDDDDAAAQTEPPGLPSAQPEVLRVVAVAKQ
jgi:hypothetical protein